MRWQRPWTWVALGLEVALASAGSLACSGDTTSKRDGPPRATNKPLDVGPSASGAPGGGQTVVRTAQGTTTMPAAASAVPAGPRGSAMIDECDAANPSGLGVAERQTLMAGGSATGMRWLYPYDRTIFPRGMLAPTLMWEGANAEFVFLHMKSSLFEYRGCLVPTAPGQLLIPQAVWDTAGAQTLGSSDPMTIELTSMAGGVASGPIAQQLVIALATLKGSIFYNTYSSNLATGPMQGIVLRIPPGGQAELFVSNECTGCHSVSANGSRLLSQTRDDGGRSYALMQNTAADPPAMNGGPRTAFGALYPDGSVYLSTSTVISVARAEMVGRESTAAALYETDTGTLVADTGIPEGALMPMFSADGHLLVFNDYALGEATGLALMDFDIASRKAANYRDVFSDSEYRPGWPFLLPDNRAVVFTRTDGMDFSGEGAGLQLRGPLPNQGGGAAGAGASAALPAGPVSDLHMLDIATGETIMLARAMGFASAADAATDTTYLPFGAEELHQNYFPTMSPVGAGGYFWVFFDSVRHYGNLGLQRQLWGAAVEIAPDGDYALDRSHPAFYLPGQEFGTGNHRAFAALDPCKQDDDTCTSGIDCCGGFCYIPDGTDSEFGIEPIGSCTSKVPTCAKTGERCVNTADCCPPEPGQPQNECLAGICTFIALPQ
jgi:hypothetical protein